MLFIDNFIFFFFENSNLLFFINSIVFFLKIILNRNLIILFKFYKFLYLLCEYFLNYEVIMIDRFKNYIEEVLFFIY